MHTVLYGWLFVLLAGTFSCIGNLMLKQSRLTVNDTGLFHLLLSPWLIGGLIFYAVNVILFAKSLDKLPVSLAYPVLAGFGFSLLTISAFLIFGEHLKPVQWLGVVLILTGITLATQS